MHPAGTIAIASGDLARYPGFTVSLLHMLRPPGTEFVWQVGINVAANFNACIRRMTGEWLWILGDDHILAPDTLIRLLDHDVDVVVPVCVRRRPPFIPVLFKEPQADTPPGQFPPWHWRDLPQHGLHEVTVAGTAGMLIKRRVFEDTGPDPWFEVGQLGSDQMNEDTHFCTKIQRAGYKIYADLDTYIGHLTPSCLWPTKTSTGEWTITLDLGNNVKFQIPPSALNALTHTIHEESASPSRADAPAVPSVG